MSCSNFIERLVGVPEGIRKLYLKDLKALTCCVSVLLVVLTGTLTEKSFHIQAEKEKNICECGYSLLAL